MTETMDMTDPITARERPDGPKAPKDGARQTAYRVIRLLRILERRTGEGKGIEMPDIIAELEDPADGVTAPVSAGKRAIFAALSALRSAGYRIEYRRPTGYHLMTRPLSDEEIVRLLAMLDRNRSIPADVRRSMSLHLAAMASADISEHLDFAEPEDPASTAEPKKRVPRPDIGPRELIERAIAQAMPVLFDILPARARAGAARERCAMQPIAIREQGGHAYLLGAVVQSQGAEDALRTVRLERIRNVECRLVDGTKLIAALDGAEDEAPTA